MGKTEKNPLNFPIKGKKLVPLFEAIWKSEEAVIVWYGMTIRLMRASTNLEANSLDLVPSRILNDPEFREYARIIKSETKKVIDQVRSLRKAEESFRKSKSKKS